MRDTGVATTGTEEDAEATGAVASVFVVVVVVVVVGVAVFVVVVVVVVPVIEEPVVIDDVGCWKSVRRLCEPALVLPFGDAGCNEFKEGE